MKLLRPSEAKAANFEGRTSEEAIRRARQELPEGVQVRCWKTRRGGILGFFAKETFVAGITPPAHSVERGESAIKLPSPSQIRPGVARTAARDFPAFDRPIDSAFSDLVERTADQVVLGADLVTEAAFSDMLAEAEATLSDAGVAYRDRLEPPCDPKPDGPEIIDGLIEDLAEIGVPSQYRPPHSQSTLDGLASALARLPRAKPIPSAGGSVIVVIGGRREVHATAQHLIQGLGLEPSDLFILEGNDSDFHRVAWRRYSKKVTVIPVEAALRSHALAETAAWIDKLRPDYVLGNVPAATKRADVARWRKRLGRIDALSLSNLADTATPGELMGELPIAYIDGLPASTLRWVLTLVNLTLESKP
ncbi:hypothetical protein EPN29_14085 [bacterium]|nr:MAG: hypothetical protein EPN29_14085 [bacterium]